MKRQEASSGPLAVIDVGAHSIRLEIVQAGALGRFEVIETLSQQIPLGRDVFVKGAIKPQNMNLAGKILLDYSEKLREYGVVHSRAIATSAVREATNRDIFIESVRLKSGIEIEVLEAPEEVRINYLAIKNELKGPFSLSGKSALICVVGTGATHICTVSNGLMKSAETLRMGALRIYEEMGQSFGLKKSADILDTFTSRVASFVMKHHFGRKKPDMLVGAGASVRLLATLKKPDLRDEVSVISARELRGTGLMVRSMPSEELAEKFNLSDLNAQSLGPCSEIIDNFLTSSKTTKLIVPSVNTRDAVIEEMLRELNNIPDPFVPDTVSCAEFLAEKYRYQPLHARNVADNATRLFDGLKELHRIGDRGRLMLEIAAILHDVGQFVNNRQHHKHACYLIQNSPLPGLSPRESSIVAAIARYHRRGMPKSSHPEYMSLSPRDRTLVSTLAGILRVADCLDHSDQRRICDFDLVCGDDRVEIITKGAYDLALEQNELRKRGDLFAEVFARKAVLK